MKIDADILKYFNVVDNHLTKDQLLDIQEQMSEIAEDYNLVGYVLSDKMIVMKEDVERALGDVPPSFVSWYNDYELEYYIFIKESYITFAKCTVDSDYFDIIDVWTEDEFIDDVIGQIEFTLEEA